MYGGFNNPGGGELLPSQITENRNLDQVYVLSLPAFAWFRADYPPSNPRYYHTLAFSDFCHDSRLLTFTRCEVVGNRQMLSIGGVNPLDVNSKTMSSDTATQGLQIFDMTAMKWSNKYDAKAAPYVTPQVVKDWYQQK